MLGTNRNSNSPSPSGTATTTNSSFADSRPMTIPWFTRRWPAALPRASWCFRKACGPMTPNRSGSSSRLARRRSWCAPHRPPCWMVPSWSWRAPIALLPPRPGSPAPRPPTLKRTAGSTHSIRRSRAASVRQTPPDCGPNSSSGSNTAIKWLPGPPAPKARARTRNHAPITGARWPASPANARDSWRFGTAPKPRPARTGPTTTASAAL